VEHVSFRRLVSEIPSTTYASHGMYYYPARFIPQVVRWAIKEYTAIGDWVLDPFAGSATVCVEAQITNRNSVSLDLNPMLEYLAAAKTFRESSWDEVSSIGAQVLDSRELYTPKWSRIRYWYPEEFLDVLRAMWAGYYRRPHPLVLIALLKTTKRFSLADDTVPKLFKSKIKTARIKSVLESNYRSRIEEFFVSALKDAHRASEEFRRYYSGGKSIVKGGVNLLDFDFDKRQYKLLVTSPPYGMAHEYIRSVKLDLAWLGFTDTQISKLIKSEIPYNSNPPNIEICSRTFKKFYCAVEPRLAGRCDAYFKSVLFVLGKAMARLKSGGVAAIFIGNATFSGVEFPFYQVFREHFESFDYSYERLLVDQIKNRRLFRGRLNSSPNGISSEYLLILRK
jgi:DNA modification methylase